jgi:hypothetical protein
MFNKKSNWEIAERLISKSQNTPQQVKNRSLMKREGNEQYMESPKGVISKFKSDRIKSNAELDFDQEWYKAKLQVSKHQLKKAVELKVKETDAEVERLLTDISRQHLKYLTELGLKNSEEREDALERLGEQTAQRIKSIQSKDWPEFLVEQILDGVIEIYQRFFDKILEK